MIRRLAYVIVFALAGTRCSADNGISGAAYLVQIGSVIASPTTVDCGSAATNAVFNVQLINTTAVDIHLLQVSSSGVVLRTSLDSNPSRQVYQIQSLPFSPTDALVRAGDGDVTVRVFLAAACPDLRVFNAQGGFVVPSYADIAITLYLTTNSGQYTTAPLIIRHTWR